MPRGTRAGVPNSRDPATHGSLTCSSSAYRSRLGSTRRDWLPGAQGEDGLSSPRFLANAGAAGLLPCCALSSSCSSPVPSTTLVLWLNCSRALALGALLFIRAEERLARPEGSASLSAVPVACRAPERPAEAGRVLPSRSPLALCSVLWRSAELAWLPARMKGLWWSAGSSAAKESRWKTAVAKARFCARNARGREGNE